MSFQKQIYNNYIWDREGYCKPKDQVKSRQSNHSNMKLYPDKLAWAEICAAVGIIVSVTEVVHLKLAKELLYYNNVCSVIPV